MRTFLAAVAVALSIGHAHIALAQDAGAVPRAPGIPYAATGIPDRIVLTPGADPSTSMAVAFRTDPRQALAEAEIRRAIASPARDTDARRVTGASAPIDTENGHALYHQVRFEDLEPGTAYSYRVRGADGWSEWIDFRTAQPTNAPFQFIYLGDTQNRILEQGARAMRQAFQYAHNPSLVIHAGDLVASRDDMTHDDEWGQWTQSGGFLFASTPQMPAAGNHEYIDVIGADGAETRTLSPHWPLQFALPNNGAGEAARTSYFVDYQGVRFIMLDGTAAIDLGALDNQTAWLEQTIAGAGERWTIVVMHQPIFTCARPEDTQPLNARWRPIFDARGVDLVLQGHDHCYGRWSDPPEPGVQRRRRTTRALNGPVYVVSVTGPKMYGLNQRVAQQADRWAEDTQMFQIIDVENDQLRYRAFTAAGELYDAFELRRDSRGRNRLHERAVDIDTPRQCVGPQGPDGFACTAEPKD